MLWVTPLASYLYDQGSNGIGRRSRMTDTTGYAAWAYDARGRVITATKQIVPSPVEYVTKFGYDDANRVITTSYPGGDVVTNTFDVAGQRSACIGWKRS
jgi:YD repeat-containing protein